MNKQVYNLLFNGRHKFGQVKGSSGLYDNCAPDITPDNCAFIDKIPTDAVKFLYHSGAIVLYTDANKTIHINDDIIPTDVLQGAIDCIIAQNPNSKVEYYKGGRIYTGGRSGVDNLSKLVL